MQIVEALDLLRGFRDGAPPRLLVILGAPGAGKSSFLRADLIPRPARDHENFFPLPVIRPERTVITGAAGLIRSLEGAYAATQITMSRAERSVGARGRAPIWRG